MLALDVVLVNGDGYWNDGSDFNVLLDRTGRFQALPHDANEAFRARGNGAVPDPLVALADTNKALRSRLLQVPALRQRYLRCVGEIAEQWLDWDTLGPRVERYVNRIAADVDRDTHKLSTSALFRSGVAGADGAAPDARTLKKFAQLRRAALLNHPDVKAAFGALGR